jgi:hypothetical protein
LYKKNKKLHGAIRNRKVPKGEEVLLHSRLAIGLLCKPAKLGDEPVTDKTGGCNREVKGVERTTTYKPARVTWVGRRVTGGADLTLNQFTNWYWKG